MNLRTIESRYLVKNLDFFLHRYDFFYNKSLTEKEKEHCKYKLLLTRNLNLQSVAFVCSVWTSLLF